MANPHVVALVRDFDFAAVVAAALKHKVAEGPVKVVLDGGELEVLWDRGRNVYMTGPAAVVCRGEAVL